MRRLWQRLRRRWRDDDRRLDELAVEQAALEHEEEERRKAEQYVPIPPLRNNTDWSGWGL